MTVSCEGGGEVADRDGERAGKRLRSAQRMHAPTSSPITPMTLLLASAAAAEASAIAGAQHAYYAQQAERQPIHSPPKILFLFKEYSPRLLCCCKTLFMAAAQL